jgi:hypothetical protein
MEAGWSGATVARKFLFFSDGAPWQQPSHQRHLKKMATIAYSAPFLDNLSTRADFLHQHRQPLLPRQVKRARLRFWLLVDFYSFSRPIFSCFYFQIHTCVLVQ